MEMLFKKRWSNKEGLLEEKTLELRPEEWEEFSREKNSGKGIPCRGNGKYKGPGVRQILPCLRNKRRCEWERWTVVQDEFRKIGCWLWSAFQIFFNIQCKGRRGMKHGQCGRSLEPSCQDNLGGGDQVGRCTIPKRKDHSGLDSDGVMEMEISG